MSLLRAGTRYVATIRIAVQPHHAEQRTEYVVERQQGDRAP
jgi:hypothetical protein